MFAVHGAWWQCWNEKLSFHAAMFIEGGLPIIWVCDSGKSGYFMVQLYKLSGIEALLTKAKGGAEFLLRIQQADGDLSASVFSFDAAKAKAEPVRAANYAGLVCAILLWAALAEVDKDPKWLAAAEKAAEACAQKYMRPGALDFNGGELDVSLRLTPLSVLSQRCDLRRCHVRTSWRTTGSTPSSTAGPAQARCTAAWGSALWRSSRRSRSTSRCCGTPRTGCSPISFCEIPTTGARKTAPYTRHSS